MGWAHRWAPVLVGVLTACAQDDLDLRLSPPWPLGSAGLVLMLDAAGQVVAPTPTFVPADGAVRLQVQTSEASELLFLEYVDQSPLLERCGARIGGPQALLPAPNSVYGGAIGDQLTLAPRPSPGLDLRYARCGPKSACDQFELITQILPLPGITLTHGAWIGEDRLALGGMLGVLPANNHLIAVDLEGQVLADHILDPVGIAGLEPDRRGGAYLLTMDGVLYQLGTDTSSLAVRGHFAPGTRLAARPDGLVLLSPPTGPNLSISPLAPPSPRPEFPEGILALGMASSERMAAILPDGIHVFDPVEQSFGTAEWNAEGFSAESRLVWAGPVLGAIGPAGALLRDPDRTWRRWAQPPSMVPVRWASAAGSRVFAVGEFGSVQLWDGQDWCEFERASDHLNWVGADPRGERAVVLSNATAYDRGPLFLRYEPR